MQKKIVVNLKTAEHNTRCGIKWSPNIKYYYIIESLNHY